MTRKSSRKTAAVPNDDTLFLKKDSAFFKYLAEQVAATPYGVKSHAEVRRLLDEELGDRTLTEELYRMRRE